MTRKQMKSHFIVHTNGQDEWIKVDKRTYDKAIDMFCDAHEAEIKELRSTINRFVEEAAMYSNALDRSNEAYEAELQAYKAKFQELEAKYNQLAHKHDVVCHDNCQNLCWENEESYCKEEGCIRNYIDPSLYIDIYEDKYKPRELGK